MTRNRRRIKRGGGKDKSETRSGGLQGKLGQREREREREREIFTAFVPIEIFFLIVPNFSFYWNGFLQKYYLGTAQMMLPNTFRKFLFHGSKRMFRQNNAKQAKCPTD